MKQQIVLLMNSAEAAGSWGPLPGQLVHHAKRTATQRLWPQQPRLKKVKFNGPVLMLSSIETPGTWCVDHQ